MVTTIKVEIMFHAIFREITKQRKIIEEIEDNCTIISLMAKLAKRYGQDFNNIIDKKSNSISNDILVMLNGHIIRATDTLLRDKDNLVITLPLGGG